MVDKWGTDLWSIPLRQGTIDFPKMFRAPLCCYGTECCTVSRHENRNFTGGLRKMNQGTVDFRLQARELGEVL
jgi:hypothetical protein